MITRAFLLPEAISEMENIELSAFTVIDLPAIVKWRTDREVNTYLRQGIRTLEEVQKWYKEYFSSDANQLLAIYFNKTLIGYCTIEGIDHQNRKCELGIVIGEKAYWHKGIGTDAIKKLADMAIAQLQMHRLFAVINASNFASMKCFSRAGFQYEGTLREAKYVDGQYRDLVIYAMLQREWKSENL